MSQNKICYSAVPHSPRTTCSYHSRRSAGGHQYMKIVTNTGQDMTYLQFATAEQAATEDNNITGSEIALTAQTHCCRTAYHALQVQNHCQMRAASCLLPQLCQWKISSAGSTGWAAHLLSGRQQQAAVLLRPAHPGYGGIAGTGWASQTVHTTQLWPCWTVLTALPRQQP